MKFINQIRIICACLLLMAMVEPARADISNSAVLFLRIAPNARAAGMGDAYVAISDDATATHWNPAGLATAPLSQNWVTINVPSNLRPIRGFAALKRGGGGSYDDYELWALTPSGLMRYNGKEWKTGEVFQTSTSDRVEQKVSSYFSLTDEKSIKAAVRKVAEKNNKYPFSFLGNLRDSVMASVPETYQRRGELAAGFDSVLAAYDQCRVNWSRIGEAKDQFDEAKKDGTISEAEADKVSFAIEKGITRYLPEELIIPYDAITSGELTSIVSSGSTILIGGTDGLVQYNGRNWRRFDIGDGLPSMNIRSLVNVGPAVTVLTDSGVVLFGSLTIDTLKAKQPLPEGEIEAIGGNSPTDLFAVVNHDLFHYDGTTWSNGMSYTAVLSDTPESLAAKFSVYKSATDMAAYLARFEAMGPAKTMPPQPADTTGATNPNTGTSSSLTPGAKLTIPYLATLKSKVTSIHVTSGGKPWLGTENGLIVMTDEGWTMAGYRPVVVAEGQSLSDAVSSSDPTSIITQEKLALIKKLNDIEGETVPAGTKVYRPSNVLQSNVIQITGYESDVYVATDSGLVINQFGTWKRADFGGFASSDGVSVARSGTEVWFGDGSRIMYQSKGQLSINMTYVKWLPELAPDLYYAFFGVAKGTGFGTIGGNITFISYGSITRTAETGPEAVGTFESFDIAFTGSYGASLTNKLKGGISIKGIYSRLSDQGTAAEKGDGKSTGFAFDLGLMYLMSRKLTLGLALTNIGPQMAYIDAAQADDLPRNLALGASYKLLQSEDTRLLLTAEVNKIMVGVDDGLSEELKQLVLNGGAEFTILDLIAFRGGYIYDDEGKIKTPTFGVSLTPVKQFKFDASYIPSNSDVALANTIRWSLSFLN